MSILQLDISLKLFHLLLVLLNSVFQVLELLTHVKIACNPSQELMDSIDELEPVVGMVVLVLLLLYQVHAHVLKKL